MIGTRHNPNAVRRRRAVSRLALAGTLLLAGCAGPVLPGGAPAGRPAQATLSLEETEALVRRAVGRRPRLRTLYATALMRFDDTPEDFSLAVNAELLARRPDRLLLRATRALGQVEAFEVLLYDETLAFHIPRRGALYEGPVSDLSGRSVDFQPGALMGHVMEPDRGLTGRIWRPAVRRAGAFVVEELGRPGRDRLRIRIDAASGELREMEELAPGGDVQFAKRYERYRELDGLIGPSAFPVTVALAWPADGRRVFVEFRTVQPDPPLEEGAWALDIPPETRIRPLAEIEVESDPAGEAAP
jgi:hypothetical protein